MKKVNDYKIDFIVCYNNSLYMEECIRYIEKLTVPEGYEINILPIYGATSMTAGYNEGMQTSDAKYKIYMHQDVFIYYRDFVKDVVGIFERNKDIGLIGMYGGVNLPPDAVIWDGWNRGATFASDYTHVYRFMCEQNTGGEYTEVEAIDGMLMATQFDIPWREDLNLGWDFYDISQSLEFRRRGYKVAIPVQQEPWCMHDCGNSKLTNYDRSRQIVLEEYKDYFSGEYCDVHNMTIYDVQDSIFEKLKILLENGEIQSLIQIRQTIGREKILSNNLVTMLNIIEVLESELAAYGDIPFLNNAYDWDGIKQKYFEIRFALMWYDYVSVYTEANLEIVQNGSVTTEAACCIAPHCMVGDRVNG